MEFKEIFTSPFTTPTTCYSCGGKSNNTTTIDDNIKSSGGNDTTETIQFATENHILGVGITSSTANKNKNDGVKISCRSVPRDSAHLTCVGYAYWDEEEEEKEEKKMKEEEDCIDTDRIESNQLSASSDSTATPTVHHRTEAMTFIDPALIEANQFKCQDLLLSSPNNMNLHRPSGPVIIDDKDDNISVMSNMNTIEGSTNQPQQQQHRRRQSGISQQQHRRNPSTTSIASLATIAQNNQTSGGISSGLVGSYHRKSQSELSRGGLSSTINSDTNNNKNNKNGEEKKFNNNKDSKQQKSKARLIIRRPDRFTSRLLSCRSDKDENDDDCEEDKNENDQEKQQQQEHHHSSSALLDFRPLCPCVARWKNQSLSRNGGGGGRGDDNCPSNNNDEASNNSNSNNNNKDIVGVWLGSADDATLRFYVPSLTEPSSLVSIALPEEHFSVDSPVMALDFCTVHWQDDERNEYVVNKNDDNNKENNGSSPTTIATTTTTMHTLAVACQDGTIQLITFRSQQQDSNKTNNNNNDIIFVDVTSERLIVDGPLSSLKLDKNRYTPLRVIVGSLCGYVCQLTYDSNNNSWEGPFMVVQDLWNPTINTEESVLVVDIWNNYIAIGTQLGRCLLYATHDSENYFPVWQVILPYSIHGITIIKNNDAVRDTEGKCSMNLAVTTRRSFHLFAAIKGGIKWRRKPTRDRYSPELARDRLLKILEEIRNENRESDLITQKLVRETIEDLIENVEKKFQEEEANVSIVVSDTITNLLNRVEQIAHENNSLSRMDSSNLGQDIAIPDPPHWEYSSSDDDDDIVGK
jgi:hypothetical protein